VIPQAPPPYSNVATIRTIPGGITVQNGRDVYEITLAASNVVRIHFRPDGRSTPRTLTVDPAAKLLDEDVRIDAASSPMTLTTTALTVKVTPSPIQIEIDAASGALICKIPAGAFGAGAAHLHCAHVGEFFGIENTSLPGNNIDRRQDIREGISRVGGTLQAGYEGDGASPLVYTKRYGLLFDSDGGAIDINGADLNFHGGSRPDVEFFAIAGAPKATMLAVADISGHPPMMPKWSLGFINTQWGSTQSEVRQIVDEYRRKSIPLDAFILDFDWKAWGEDNYGEWRWNSTSGPGNVSPNKFPDGASGAFASDLLAQGVKLGGIFKPRILMTNVAGKTDEAAAYALAHHLFFGWQSPYTDYFSGRASRDIDFSLPLARSWYWEHTLPAYRSGLVAFWNDEADATTNMLLFPNFQFLNMERSLYDGVRSAGDQRVFSINRNFYLGAQRYAYAEWSGDIETGFDSMREQATRMLGTVDLGEPHWSMDGGGFFGHPSPENYARWMQFAAFVPIMRVHGTLGEKRQPWVYGDQAERVATDAINLRYQLLPYFYSLEREAYETGVGIVRPLVWEYPNDAEAADKTDEWMDGDALLVAPVFGQGEAHRDVYLPAGSWYDYFRGTRYDGGTTIDYPVNPQTWADIPLFVRAGSIVATQAVQQWVGQSKVTNVRLDVFPSPARKAVFMYYDDDGATYAYERGLFFKQTVTVTQDAGSVQVSVSPSSGSYATPLQMYTLVIHGVRAPHAGKSGTDRFGPMTTIVVPAGSPSEIHIDASSADHASVFL
jgi:alpha-glucosidase